MQYSWCIHLLLSVTCRMMNWTCSSLTEWVKFCFTVMWKHWSLLVLLCSKIFQKKGKPSLDYLYILYSKKMSTCESILNCLSEINPSQCFLVSIICPGYCAGRGRYQSVKWEKFWMWVDWNVRMLHMICVPIPRWAPAVGFVVDKNAPSGKILPILLTNHSLRILSIVFTENTTWL